MFMLFNCVLCVLLWLENNLSLISVHHMLFLTRLTNKICVRVLTGKNVIILQAFDWVALWNSLESMRARSVHALMISNKQKECETRNLFNWCELNTIDSVLIRSIMLTILHVSFTHITVHNGAFQQSWKNQWQSFTKSWLKFFGFFIKYRKLRIIHRKSFDISVLTSVKHLSLAIDINKVKKKKHTKQKIKTHNIISIVLDSLIIVDDSYISF